MTFKSVVALKGPLSSGAKREVGNFTAALYASHFPRAANDRIRPLATTAKDATRFNIKKYLVPIRAGSDAKAITIFVDPFYGM